MASSQSDDESITSQACCIYIAQFYSVLFSSHGTNEVNISSDPYQLIANICSTRQSKSRAVLTLYQLLEVEAEIALSSLARRYLPA